MDRHSNGTFAPGHRGFKPRGAVSQYQLHARARLGEFLKEKLDDLHTIYLELAPKEKARLLLTVAEFYLPKMREVYIEDEPAESRYHYDKLSTETLREVAALQLKIKLEIENHGTENRSTEVD